MVKLRLWNIFLVLFQILSEISASTHWVVTESGRIQPQLDSPFYLHRPYDLLALLDQETRRTDINTVYQDLVSRKFLIDNKWTGLEGASDLIAKVYSQVEDCILADKLLNEIDLYDSVGANGTNTEGVDIAFEKSDIKDNQDTDYLVPDCKKFSNLEFSMSAYEHLSAMRNRSNIVIPPEKALENLMPVESLKEFGRGISAGLMKNSTSWLHYNLASIYWRIRGKGLKAIECSRRALHFVPRTYRHIPLLNLASTFHIARYSSDAALLLHAAVDHASQEPDLHVALGKVYAALTEYNRSAACFDNVLKLRPDWTEMKQIRHSVLCHLALESELMDLHETLQSILSELHEYHSQQQQWLRLQERLLWEQAPLEAQLAGFSSEKLSSLVTNRGQRCVHRNSADSNPIISCDIIESQTAANQQMDVTLNLQRLLRNVESETQKISQQMFFGKNDVSNFGSENVISSDKVNSDTKENNNRFEKHRTNMPWLLHEKFPTTLPTSNDKYFDATGWPTKEECVEWDLPITEPDDLELPVFLPLENKGYQIDKMLSEYIGLAKGAEHELPWYPPVCDYTDKGEGIALPPNIHKQMENSPLKFSKHLRDHLSKYVNDGKAEDAEIGQRIVAAIHKKTGPDWVLATLASLYWRVRLNTLKALDCLEVAFQTAPKEHTDVILVSYASLLYHHGLTDDAIKLAMVAIKANFVEPSTNFLLAIMHFSKSNPILAMYYMKNVLRVDPSYYDGHAEKLLKTWACRIKLGGYSETTSKSKKANEGICTEKDSFSGEGVICSANGDQCKTATIQCVRADHHHNSPGIADTVHSSKENHPERCTKFKTGLGNSVISTILAEEGSGDVEPDQSKIETFSEDSQLFHMRISVDDGTNSGDESGPTFHVFDKSGTYPLSLQSCQQIRESGFVHFSSIWPAIASRNIDISPFMRPLLKSSRDVKPYCSEGVSMSSETFDHLATMILRKQLPDIPEGSLTEWLGLMAGDKRASIAELGAKIGVSLQENTTSWILATAAALYWRVVGNTEQAVTCLRQALTYVPSDMKDIPLISLANVLHRVGFPSDALEVALTALNSRLNFVVNHYTVGNIYASMGDLEKAISFYRSALDIDPNFEPARNRLQAILCRLLLDDGSVMKELTDFTGM